MPTNTTLKRHHTKGLHDTEALPACPYCQIAAAEAASLIRAEEERSASASSSTKSKKSKAAKSDPRAKQIAEEWISGLSLALLVSRHGPISRSNLRRMITIEVGGKAKFNELRAQGAGGSKVKKATVARGEKPGRAGPQVNDGETFTVLPGDATAKVITRALIADGWKYRTIRGISIHTSPDGIDYIAARPNEHCDLIYHYDSNHPAGENCFPDQRFRILNNKSSKGRKLTKAVAQHEEIKAATAQRVDNKRAKRISRKAS